MDIDASASMCMPSLLAAVTLTFELQHLIRPSLGANEYPLSVSSRLLKPFIRYHGMVTLQQNLSGRTRRMDSDIANTVECGKGIKPTTRTKTACCGVNVILFQELESGVFNF